MQTSGSHGYDAIEDPYCFPGTTLLKNIPGLRDAVALERFETASTTQRSDEPLPAVRAFPFATIAPFITTCSRTCTPGPAGSEPCGSAGRAVPSATRNTSGGK